MILLPLDGLASNEGGVGMINYGQPFTNLITSYCQPPAAPRSGLLVRLDECGGSSSGCKLLLQLLWAGGGNWPIV